MCTAGVLAIHTRCAQHWLLEQLLRQVRSRTTWQVTCGDLHIHWPGKISLIGVAIANPDGLPVVSIEEIKCKVAPVRSLLSKALVFGRVNTHGLRIRIDTADQGTDRIDAGEAKRIIPNLDFMPFTLRADSVDIDDAVVQMACHNQIQSIHRIHQAHLQSVKMCPRSVSTRVVALRYQSDVVPVAICHFQANIYASPSKIRCQGIKVETPHSALEGDFEVQHRDPLTWQNTMQQAEASVRLRSSSFDASELAFFVPDYAIYMGPCCRLQGTLKKTAQLWQIPDLKLMWDADSSLNTALHIDQAAHVEQTKFTLELKRSVINRGAGVSQLLTALEVPRITEAIWPVHLQGSCTGTLDAFATRIEAETAVGSCRVQAEVAPGDAWRYSATAAAQQVDLCKLFDQTYFSKTSFSVHLAGNALGSENQRLQWGGQIEELICRDYTYRDIQTKGTFNGTRLTTQNRITDPNLALRADAQLVFQDSLTRCSLQTILERADLQNLQITDHPIRAAGHIDVDMRQEKGALRSASVKISDTKVYVADAPPLKTHLKAYIAEANDTLSLKLESPILDLKAEGLQNFAQAAADLPCFIRAHHMFASLNAPLEHPEKTYSIRCTMHCKDMDPLCKLLTPNLHLDTGMQLEAAFECGPASHFELRVTHPGTISFADWKWRHIEGKMWAKRSVQQPLAHLKAQLTCREQRWSDGYETHDLRCNILRDGKKIRFNTQAFQKDGHTQVALGGQGVLDQAGWKVQISPCMVNLQGRCWSARPENQLVVESHQVTFKKLEMSHLNQTICVEGVLGSNSKLQLQVENFPFSNLNMLSTCTLGGTAHGQVVLQGSLKQPLVEGKFMGNALSINGMPIGNLRVQAAWKKAQEQLELSARVEHKGIHTVRAQGIYKPWSQTDSLQLHVDFDQAQLALLEPFLKKEVTDIDGTLEGAMQVTGSVRHPRLSGKIRLRQASATVTYLHTPYRFDGEIDCRENLWTLRSLAVSDRQDGRGLFAGTIDCRDFDHIKLQLSGDMYALRVIHTAQNETIPLYGTGIFSGSASVLGELTRPQFNLKLKTEPGTHLHICLQGENAPQTSEFSFIRFIDPTSSAPVASEIEALDLRPGIALDVALEVTPQALTEIAFNPQEDDIISAQGKGVLSFTTDADGNFQISGGLSLEKGSYKLARYKVVRKTLDLLPSSTIAWTGDPAAGSLHIRAALTQRVSLQPLLHKTSAAGLNRYPVRVIATVQGTMAEPDIGFEIAFPELPQNAAERAAIHEFESKAQSDENYLISQVISLMAFKRFVDQEFRSAGEDMVSNGVGELLSYGMSSLVHQLDENLELSTDWDIKDLNDKGLESVHFRVGYNFLNGRLRVCREGGVGMEGGKFFDTTGLLGDLSVEYILSQNGRFTLKGHTKTVKATPTDSTTRVRSVGGSVSYVQGFSW